MRKVQAKVKKKHGGSQSELVSAMVEPGFYPKRPSKVTHKETRISHVFLTDDLVYKMKRFNRLAACGMERAGGIYARHATIA